MRTPKEYTDNINCGIITKRMLSDCLFSVNKRAKNFRDKEREYHNYYRSNRYAYDKYDNEEKNRMKKEEYYEQKEKLLSVISPTCIHKEFCGYERRRIYDFESEYDSYDGEFVYENSYWDSDEERRVHFGDVELIDEPVFKYYLFYDLGCHTFHTPLDESMANAYSDLSVIIIDHLITEGKEIAELLSAQFMKKVISLIDSGEYRLKEI